VPLLGGERPIVLDPWMLRLAADADPAVSRPLVERLRRGSVAAIVLFQDVGTPEADAWYARGNLGPEVVAEVERSYRLAARAGIYRVYVPREVDPGDLPVAAVPERPRPTATPIPAAAARERRATARP
jgi:hypothetical protein